MTEPVAPHAIARPAARVLLLDPDDRVLLARFVSPDTGVAFWAPVGGGLEVGESHEQAAVREVFEETGLAGLVLGPHVWNRRVSFTWRGRRLAVTERWYVARVAPFVPTDAGWTAEERVDLRELRWWTPAELADAHEALVPLDLAVRLAGLLRAGPPTTPVDVGF